MQKTWLPNACCRQYIYNHCPIYLFEPEVVRNTSCRHVCHNFQNGFSMRLLHDRKVRDNHFHENQSLQAHDLRGVHYVSGEIESKLLHNPEKAHFLLHFASQAN